MKKCLTCKKISSAFYPKRGSCKSCISIRVKKYYAKNKLKLCQYQEKYRKENSEKTSLYKILNKKALYAYNRLYTKRNAARINFRNRKRALSKLKRTPSWLTKEHLQQIEAFYIKALTLTKQTGIVHEVDHIIPLQGKNVSGLHVPWNLQILTKSENCKKRNFF